MTPEPKPWDDELVWFLDQLQQKLGVSKLEICAQHTRGGLIFRGHPSFRSKPWRDWAMVNWGQNSYLPGQIWCFVVINTLTEGENSGILHGGIELENGHYAVVECADYTTDPNEKKKSDIFMAIIKEVAQTADGDRPWRRKFYLANVEAIVQPLVVVPNIGGKLGQEFFIVQPRSGWVAEFKAMLEDPPESHAIGAEEPVPSHPIVVAPAKDREYYRNNQLVL